MLGRIPSNTQELRCLQTSQATSMMKEFKPFPHIFWHWPDGVAPPGQETRGLSRGQIDDQVQVLENEEPNLTSERA